MYTRSVLITGSNRGIGLELVKQLATKTEYVFAGCRIPAEAQDLQSIAEKNKNVTIIYLDVCEQSSIDTARDHITGVLGEQGLSCLINNAGRAHPRTNKIEDVTADDLMSLYNINTVGPTMVTKAFLPLLRKASKINQSQQMGVSRATILNMSSKVGSITDNSSGRNYGYRMAKIALNMCTKNLSIELKDDGILAVALHPGWVKTDMGGPNAHISTEVCVENLLKVTANFTEKENGSFQEWNGNVIPW